MATNTIVGSVARLWTFPVKSMRGERIEQGEFTDRGLVGDRAYALMDADTGKVVSEPDPVRLPAPSFPWPKVARPKPLGR